MPRDACGDRLPERFLDVGAATLRVTRCFQFSQVVSLQSRRTTPRGQVRPIYTLVQVCGDFIRAVPNSPICTPLTGRPGSSHAEPSRGLLGAAKQHRARPGG
jgi:hypothetical protein